MKKPNNHVSMLEKKILTTIAHEVGHVIVGDGHPNKDGGGPAPLPGTAHRERLMYSLTPYHLSFTRLVKGEWDEAEAWFKNRPNGDR